MKKLLMVAIVLAVAVSLVATPVLAGKNGQAGKSNIGHLYLYEKDQDTWEIVEGGAWGKMKYNLSGSTFDFVFNGHELEAGWDYTLIYYPDPWPGDGLICLGFGTTNDGGNVNIKGSFDTGDLPIPTDKNNADNDDCYEYINEDYNGAKIWLILADDYDCEDAAWNAWNGASYLFEADLITFDDTDE